MKYVIACSKKWFEKSLKKKFLNNQYLFIRKKSDLNLKKLSKIKPKYIFFPHWSYLVPKKIYEKYECVCFHAAPLPYGRGGSPIQNLIKKKINKTPICALKMNGITDGGPIYGKKNVSLNGSLNEIFLKMSPIIQGLIQFITKNNPTPKNQKGKPYNFKRIKPVESSLLNKKNLFDIYDQIRMVDNEEYPRAFIKIGNYKIEFREAQLKKNQIQAKVEIKKI